ncbi:MAG: hypothetical protein ABR589_03685 [Chthoniobacterales bacterium]
MSNPVHGLGNDITINVIASIIASAILLAAGFLWGKYKERKRFGRRLEEYDFYPYTINRDNFPEFSLNNFRLGMHYFLRNTDPTAARQLIFIGEQNNVRNQLELAEQKVYALSSTATKGKRSPMTRASISRTSPASFASSANHFRTPASRSSSTTSRTHRTRWWCSRTTSPVATCATARPTWLLT